MIERNGMCYADDFAEVLCIVDARYLGDFRLSVRFSTGETRIFDGRVLLDFEVFKPLADESVFRNFKLDYETLTWLDGTADIAPEFVLKHSVAADTRAA